MHLPALHVRHLASIRRWEDENLPIYGSLLGHDLILLVAQLYLERRRFTMKEIYFGLPYSENAIRLHLKRLIREGWLVANEAGPDRRFRFLKPSEKLLQALERYVALREPVGLEPDRGSTG